MPGDKLEHRNVLLILKMEHYNHFVSLSYTHGHEKFCKFYLSYADFSYLIPIIYQAHLSLCLDRKYLEENTFSCFVR